VTISGQFFDRRGVQDIKANHKRSIVVSRFSCNWYVLHVCSCWRTQLSRRLPVNVVTAVHRFYFYGQSSNT